MYVHIYTIKLTIAVCIYLYRYTYVHIVSDLSNGTAAPGTFFCELHGGWVCWTLPSKPWRRGSRGKRSFHGSTKQCGGSKRTVCYNVDDDDDDDDGPCLRVP